MPALRDAEAVDVQDVDQCFYDLVADDNFILGNVPDFANVYVGVGWRGTGYKYATWVGQTLAQLALHHAALSTTLHALHRNVGALIKDKVLLESEIIPYKEENWE